MGKVNQALERLQYEYSVAHCGETYSWPGKAPDVRYVCRLCGGKMKVTETEVRTLDEAKLALRGHQYQETCGECGTKTGHLLIRKDEALFLECGQCGEELTEVDDERAA